MSASSDWSLTPRPGLSLVRVRSLSEPLKCTGQGRGMAPPGSCYLSRISQFPGRVHITPSRQININHRQGSSSQYLHVGPWLSGLSQSDLINSWHKTGRNAKPHTPGHSTGGGANLWGRVFIRVSKTSGNSIIERLVWPPRMMKLTIF